MFRGNPGNPPPTGDTNIDFQDFTTSGLWEKPENAKSIYVQVWGAGGGGGSGQSRGAGGGGGGMYIDATLDPSEVLDAESIIIGAGGIGGATTSNPGTSGGDSSFGSRVIAYGGGGGEGGTATTGDAIDGGYSGNPYGITSNDGSEVANVYGLPPASYSSIDPGVALKSGGVGGGCQGNNNPVGQGGDSNYGGGGGGGSQASTLGAGQGGISLFVGYPRATAGTGVAGGDGNDFCGGGGGSGEAGGDGGICGGGGGGGSVGGIGRAGGNGGGGIIRVWTTVAT